VKLVPLAVQLAADTQLYFDQASPDPLVSVEVAVMFGSVLTQDDDDPVAETVGAFVETLTIFDEVVLPDHRLALLPADT
jgi:hypothetical protein